MNKDFERTSEVVNGYFYTYAYKAIHEDPAYDELPFIYCLAPHPKSQNCFVGINLHHLPTSERIDFLIELEKLYHILDNEERAIVDIDVIRRTMPSAKLALRVYNRKNVRRCYRVLNKAVGRYIDNDGDIYLAKPSTIMNKYWTNYAGAKSAKSQEPEQKEE